MTLSDEWPPERARSLSDWTAYWKRQRWDRRLRRNLGIRMAPLKRKLALLRPYRIRGAVLHRTQRLQRGWSYRDLWGMDHFIAQLCGGMAARLLEVAHGYPCSGHDDCPHTFPEQPCKCACKQNYDEALKQISAGLLAYAADTPLGLPVAEWQTLDEERIKAGQEAFRLLAEWLPTLWD